MQRDVYTTAQPDGTFVTTTTTTKLAEQRVYGFGRGPLNRYYLTSPAGIVRVVEIILGLIIISLIVSVFGPGPFKGILFGQSILLVFAGVCLCLSFIFLVVFVFTLHQTHLDFWPWRVTDLAVSVVASISFALLGVVEAYYATGAWSNNCNDIGGDGVVHNGCRFIFEWAFAAFFCFVQALLYAISALFAYRSQHDD